MADYNVSFEVAGTFVLAIILASLGVHFTNVGPRRRSFMTFTSSTLLAEVLDVCSVLMLRWDADPTLLYLCNGGYYFAAALSGYFLVQYTRTRGENNALSGPLLQLDRLVLLGYALLLVSNVWTGVVFTLENSSYLFGPAHIIVYLMPGYFLLHGFVRVLSTHTAYTLKEMLCNLGFVFLMVSGMVLQCFFFPDVLLTVFNTSLGILALLFGLETKDYPKLVKALEELEYLHKNLEREVERQSALARQRELQVEQMSLDTVHALALSIDAKDEYTRGHSTRVAQYSRQLARALGWVPQHVEQLSNAALLHDIGKIGVPDSILKKPSTLDDEEYAVIKNHTLWGAEILKNVTNIPDATVVARSHHERWDGTGYPDGLAGTQIPLGARIVAIADAYDAMSSARVYRQPLSHSTIRSELLQGRGTQFDPQLLDAFLPLFDSGELNKIVD